MADDGQPPAITDVGQDEEPSEAPVGEMLVSLDFETGLADLSAYDSAFSRGDEDNLVDGFDGQAYRIGDRDQVGITRGNEQIHSLHKFALELDIQLLEDDSSGRFVHFNGVMEAAIEKDRSISFKLFTDEGRVTLNSGSVTFDDGEPHTFSVAYDDAAGRVAMAIDDQIVDSAALTGTTASETFFGLSLGETWRDAPTALIDNFFLGTDAEDVGIDLPATLGDALLANMVDPDPDYGTSESEGDDLEDDGLYKDGNSAVSA